MNVLVIGRGGREHAICQALKKDSNVEKIYCAKGNGGIKNDAIIVDIDETSCEELASFAIANNIDLTIVGPEASLEEGIVDVFTKKNLKIFGPSKQATQIESSKKFAKEIMMKYDIPTAKYQSFTNYDDALSYCNKIELPLVIKYDGLAAGKGVVICQTTDDYERTLNDMLVKKIYGSEAVIVEQFLEGQEFSMMAFVAHGNVYPMVVAQDHKRAFDGDQGPNTGGMGAYAPFPLNDDEYQEAVSILEKCVKGLKNEGIDYQGVLYGGLMKTKEGVKVIEFNARFGDPETEVVLPLLASPLASSIIKILDGENPNLKWLNKKTVGVVLASRGYPSEYTKGLLIDNLSNLNVNILHMGTKEENGKIFTSGGRVLLAYATSDSIDDAAEEVYEDIKKIRCDGLFYRLDIAYQMRKKLNSK